MKTITRGIQLPPDAASEPILNFITGTVLGSGAMFLLAYDYPLHGFRYAVVIGGVVLFPLMAIANLWIAMNALKSAPGAIARWLRIAGWIIATPIILAAIAAGILGAIWLWGVIAASAPWWAIWGIVMIFFFTVESGRRHDQIMSEIRRRETPL